LTEVTFCVEAVIVAGGHTGQMVVTVMVVAFEVVEGGGGQYETEVVTVVVVVAVAVVVAVTVLILTYAGQAGQAAHVGITVLVTVMDEHSVSPRASSILGKAEAKEAAKVMARKAIDTILM